MGRQNPRACCKRTPRTPPRELSNSRDDRKRTRELSASASRSLRLRVNQARPSLGRHSPCYRDSCRTRNEARPASRSSDKRHRRQPRNRSNAWWPQRRLTLRRRPLRSKTDRATCCREQPCRRCTAQSDVDPEADIGGTRTGGASARHHPGEGRCLAQASSRWANSCDLILHPAQRRRQESVDLRIGERQLFVVFERCLRFPVRNIIGSWRRFIDLVQRGL